MTHWTLVRATVSPVISVPTNEPTGKPWDVVSLTTRWAAVFAVAAFPAVTQMRPPTRAVRMTLQTSPSPQPDTLFPSVRHCWFLTVTP